MERCTKEWKHLLDELMHAYKEEFKKPKWLPPKSEVDQDIPLWLLWDPKVRYFIELLPCNYFQIPRPFPTKISSTHCD